MKTALQRLAISALLIAVTSQKILTAAEPRLVTPEEAATLTPSTPAATYLTGSYTVTISSADLRKAILKPAAKGLQLRVVVTYPVGTDIPNQGTTITLGAEGTPPCRITSISKDPNNILTITAELEQNQ
jgi:hypothetical protein